MNTTNLDAMLARIKAPLRSLREQHGVVDDVVYRIWYAPTGQVVNVAVHMGPFNLPPAFVASSISTIGGMLAFPRTLTGGELLFTDLGRTSVSAAAINAHSDQRAVVEQQTKSKRTTITILAVTVIAIIAYVAVEHPRRQCVKRGVEYYRSIGPIQR